MSLSWVYQTTLAALGNETFGAATSPGGTTIVHRFGQYGISHVYRATDGGLNGAASWTDVTGPVFNGGAGFVFYNNGVWYTGGYGGILFTSTDDGVTFVRVNFGSALIYGGAGDGAFCVVMDQAGTTPNIVSEDNGTTFALSALPSGWTATSSNLWTVIWDGSQFVVIADDGAGNYSAFTAPGAFGGGGPVWTASDTVGSPVTAGNSGAQGQLFGHDPAQGYICVGYDGTTHGLFVSPTIAGWFNGAMKANPLTAGHAITMATAANGRFFIGNYNTPPDFAESADSGASWALTPTNFNPANAPEYPQFITFDAVHACYLLFGSMGSVSTALASAPVPNVAGDTLAAAETAIVAAGFVIGSVTSAPSSTFAGLVISTFPAIGTSLPPGTIVSIVVSSGPTVAVPDLIGMTAAQAAAALALVGLVLGNVSAVTDSSEPIGSIATQSLAAGTEVLAGTAIDVGVSFVVPQFDVDATVISQYANSPTLMQLVENFGEYFDPSQNIQNFYLTVWNIDTAEGFGLDIWGIILHVSRVIPIPGSSGSFGFQNSDLPPDWENFGNENVAAAGGPFFSGQITGNSYKLADGPYRTLLLTKALANICATTAPALNALITNLFPGRGVCYTLDTGAMTMSYVFNFALTNIEIAILSFSGVLPHPAGVGVNIIVIEPGHFGFEEAGSASEPFDFGTFYNG